MTASNVIAIVSVCIAGLALWRSWRAGREASEATREANDLMKQQVALHERLTQIEQSREQARLMQSLQAALRAELRKSPGGTWRLFVINTGQGEARDVAIMLDGKPLLEHDAVPRGEEEAKTIGPESEISYCMALAFSCHPPFEFEATWSDDSGEPGHYETTVSF